MRRPLSRSIAGGGSLPRTARGQRTREMLIRAAEDEFGDAGYYEAGIAGITRRAGVALGTFYLYFSSKEELFRALLWSLNHDLRRALNRATRDLTTRAEREEEGLRAFFRFLARHRKLYRIVKEAESVDPRLYRDYYERIADRYGRGLARAMNRGEFRRLDPELVAYALMGIADFTASRYVVWEDGPIEPKVRQLAEMILHGLLASGAKAGTRAGAEGPADRSRAVARRGNREG